MIDNPFDSYVWQARRAPAALATLPVALACLAWLPSVVAISQPLLAVGVGASVMLVLTHVARDAGKRAEAKLLRKWGALPSTIILRHGDSTIDPVTKHRYHQVLARLVPGIRMPSPDDEVARRAEADAVYDACATFLRSQTRDAKRFPLVRAENIDYGFRRNTLGLRSWGLSLGAAGLAVCGARLYILRHHLDAAVALPLICFAACFLLLSLWLFVVKPDWVRRAGDGYALRLLEAIDQLPAAVGAPVPSPILLPTGTPSGKRSH